MNLPKMRHLTSTLCDSHAYLTRCRGKYTHAKVRGGVVVAERETVSVSLDGSSWKTLKADGGEVAALGMDGRFVAVAVWGGEGCTLYETGENEREIGKKLRDVRG